MRDLSNRNVRDDDYFSFIITLSKDQQVIDGHVEETKMDSDDVLKALRNLMEDFDESEKSLKDQILSDCRKLLNTKMSSLPDLEEKLRRLESGVDTSVKTSYNALQVLDKNHPDWNEVSKLNKDMTQLERDTKELRLDKDNLTTQIERIIQILDSTDPKVMPMNKVLEIQESTNKVSQDHEKTSIGIDEALDKLRDYDSKLQKLLQGIRDDFKRKTDRLNDDIKDRLNGITRFLRPT
jgi:peroxiredoxin family protein